MALEIQKGSQWWYGRVEHDGKVMVPNLGVKISGNRPKSLRDKGDEAFERSRAEAQAELTILQFQLKQRGSAEELVQKLHEIRTGRRIGCLPLTDIHSTWGNVRGYTEEKKLEPYFCQTETLVAKFVAFLNAEYPAVKELGDVHQYMAEEYMETLAADGTTGKTYNNKLIFFRSCCEALIKKAGLAENPFTGIPLQPETTIFRLPFSVDDLAAILTAAREDSFIEPVIITGICTAARRGNCCLLKKSDLDLANGFISTLALKTQKPIWIPIFPELANLLSRQPKNDSEYVFPELAAMYLANADGITWRVKKVFAKAGFFDPDDTMTEEELARCKGALQQEREKGVRKASIRGFQSFRVTWVTLALMAGVKMETIRKVTGHQTANLVEKHYFQPSRDAIRAELSAKLPSLLGGIPIRPTVILDSPFMEAKLAAMTQESWSLIRDELLAALRAG